MTPEKDRDPLIDYYRQQVAACRTENLVNRVHIALENLLAPAEVRRLAAGLGSSDDPADALGRQWLATLTALLQVNRPRPVEFERIPILEGMTRYAAAGRARDKTLVLGFAGRANRMMLPTAVLLDCLDPAGYDVVVLRDAERAMYVRGIPGLGGSFFEVLASLRDRVDPSSYRNAIALGTSAGGLPAVLAAVALGLGAGISVGGQDCDALAACAARNGASFDPYRRLIESAPAARARLLLVCGAGNTGDRAAAQAVAKRIAARIVGVSDCDTHAVLGQLAKQHRLRAFLAKAFDQGLENAWPVVRHTTVADMPQPAVAPRIRVRLDGLDLTALRRA